MSHAELSLDDLGAIKALFPLAAEPFLAGDFAGWASGYAEDGMLMPPNGPTVVGRGAEGARGELTARTQPLCPVRWREPR